MLQVRLEHLSAGKHFRFEDDLGSPEYEIIMWKDYICHYIDEDGNPGEIDTERNPDVFVFTDHWNNSEEDIPAEDRWKWYERDKSKKLVKESISYYMNEEDNLKGGVGDKTKKSEIDPRELSIGKLVEKEHTSSNKTAEEIATDHLTENKKYYSLLVEKGMVDEEAAIKKYVEHFGKSKLPEKYKKMLDKNKK